jgi:FAD:protein FMN transferase
MRKFIIFLSVITLLLASCGRKDRELKFVNIRGVVFGTYYSISYYCPDGKNYQDELDSLFAGINRSLSYYDPNSLISRINRNETNVADDYFLNVLKRSLEIAVETNGVFDPTVSPLVNAWGFGFAEKENMTPAKIDSLRAVTGYQRVSIQGNKVIKEIPEIQFDFNAIAKGYASDLGGQLLAEKGIKTYMVELGGDLIAVGLKPDGSPWRIGLEKPAKDKDQPQDWDFLVEMRDKAVATSGNYRKYYEEGGQRFSHTIDPATGYPVSHNLLSASVFAADCITADAFATAFMVMGLEKTREFISTRSELQVFLIYDIGSGEYGTFTSEGLKVTPRSEL